MGPRLILRADAGGNGGQPRVTMRDQGSHAKPIRDIAGPLERGSCGDIVPAVHCDLAADEMHPGFVRLLALSRGKLQRAPRSALGVVQLTDSSVRIGQRADPERSVDEGRRALL